MERIMECVPNFSEGRRLEVIETIVEAISSGGEMAKCEGRGVQVLHVDRGEAADRTVVTFVGSPEAVVEAAFQAVKTASELIDMRLHHGTHPRIGATDVLPLVPVSGISLRECAEMATALAKRISDELGIPCYCYEAAARKPARRNLAVCRSGEYEGLKDKMEDSECRPDFGPDTFTVQAARSGAVNVGAREFLIAVNFNLDTTSADIATEIACDVREKGRRRLDPRTGVPVIGPDGRPEMIPGPLRGCKAIGWYIDEYGVAQVSMNITDISATSLHTAYLTVCRAAEKYGVRVTGTEIIGLVPKCVLVDAGMYFAGQDAGNFTEEQLVGLAVNAMHLDDLCPFDPRSKVIEYVMQTRKNNGA